MIKNLLPQSKAGVVDNYGKHKQSDGGSPWVQMGREQAPVSSVSKPCPVAQRKGSAAGGPGHGDPAVGLDLPRLEDGGGAAPPSPLGHWIPAPTHPRGGVPEGLQRGGGRHRGLESGWARGAPGGGDRGGLVEDAGGGGGPVARVGS